MYFKLTLLGLSVVEADREISSQGLSGLGDFGLAAKHFKYDSFLEIPSLLFLLKTLLSPFTEFLF